MSTHGQSQAQFHDRKAEVQAALQLDSGPTDEFMALLAELGDADVATDPRGPTPTRNYAPSEIEEIVIKGDNGRAAHSRTRWPDVLEHR